MNAFGKVLCIIAPITLALAGCAGDATPTLRAAISKEEALRIGLRAARVPGPELSVALEEPYNPHAELMTLADAKKRLKIERSYAPGEKPDQPVWLVTCEGTWRDEFPRPPDIPTAPANLHHFALIVNASTGEALTQSVGP